MAALLFVVGLLAWAWRADKEERSNRRASMIADALSTEAQLRARLDSEMGHLQELARALPGLPRSATGLASNVEVVHGLRRMWLSVTWLDANHRIIAHVPDQGTLTTTQFNEFPDVPGVSAHLNLFAGDERLVLRYSPTQLLRRGIPWWVARKYDVELMDASEQVIAVLGQVPLRSSMQERESYQVAVGSNMPGAFLELMLRETPRPFWRTVPLVWIGGFLTLMLIATVLLRGQVRRISQAQSAWRTEAGWRQAMEDSALVGLRARDAEGRILYVNRTFCEMVGMGAAQLVGLRPPMPYWPPDALEEVMQRNQRNLQGRAPREGYEAEWCHPSGRRLHVMVFESPLIDAQGQQIGWMGSIIDISARKQLEERERHQSEALAHQARLTTLGEVASALAHQLNQPLTVIMGYNTGLQRMLADAAPANPAIMNALAQQGQQAAEAGRIVRRIREFLTRRTPQREACDLQAVAQRAAALLQRDLRAAQVHLQWALADTLPLVFADSILLEQVLINLLRNACDALISVPPRADGRCIRMATQPDTDRFAHRVRLDVEDNGPGLDGKSVEQLSAAFYSTKAEGMGMGLAICRSILELHHGSMEAGISSMGGARLSFTLPVFRSEE
ncbi:MAG: PAS domain S-box protein [Rhodoferax sp.]|nr:PAS domain S-box protein [Rhodoferax sp.]